MSKVVDVPHSGCKNAIVRVIRDNKKEPVTLKDIVVKHTKITGK